MTSSEAGLADRSRYRPTEIVPVAERWMRPSRLSEQTKADLVLAAHRMGIAPGKVGFSHRIEWITVDGKLALREARCDPNSGRVTLWLGAIECDAVEMLKDCIASGLVVREWDESEHPRDEDGKFTFGGGGEDEGGGRATGGGDHPGISSDLDIRPGHPMPSQSGIVTVDVGYSNLPSSYHDIAISINPTMSEIKAIANEEVTGSNTSGVRVLQDRVGNLVAWPAGLVIHSGMMDALKDVETMWASDQWHMDGGRLVSDTAPGTTKAQDWINRGQQNAKNAEATSVSFISPNVKTDLDFNGAVSALKSSQQAAFMSASADIDRAIGIKAKETPIIGAWSDGAENSVMATAASDWDHLVLAAAMKGHLADQKSVLVFQQQRNGDAVLSSFRADGKLEDIHKNLLQDGLAFHTLVPTANGAVVYVADLDGSLADNVEKGAARYDSKVTVQFGRAEFIGDTSGQGSDREQRDRARGIYEKTIRESAVSGSGAAWNRIRNSWSKAPDKIAASFQSEHSRASEDEGHWVTIGGHHIFIDEEGGGEGGGEAEGGDSSGISSSSSDINHVSTKLGRNSIISDAGSHKANSRSVAVVAKDVNARASRVLKDNLGVKEISKPDPATDKYLVATISKEIKSAIKEFPEQAHWYGDDIKKTMKIASAMYPEIAKDKDAQFIFRVSMAISSQGGQVNGSASMTTTAYEHFQKTGKFPLIGFRAQGNFKKMNALIGKFGVSKTREFFDKQFTARDLEKATGIKIYRTGKDDLVYGSAVLGPKIGQGFYQNLNGNFKPITMDRWFMRMWGRITATGIGKVDMGPVADRLRNALKAEGRSVPKDEAKLADAARAINKAYEDDYKKNREDYDSGKKEKTELVYAAERFVHNKDNGMVEEPGSASHRHWIENVFEQAVKQTGLTNAAAQAVIWTPEQDMYKKLGAIVPEVGNSYSKAFAKIAAARGINV